MVKIKYSKYPYYLSEFRNIIYVLILLLISQKAHTQDTLRSMQSVKKIEILYADVWEVNEKMGKDLQRLLGNVKIKHNDVTMLCDSAYFYKNSNHVKAYSKIHIEQGDTLDLYGDYLYYDGITEIATIEGNVELIDKETHLFTKELEYDVKNKVARYNKKGRITNADNVLTSDIGIYYRSDNLFHFKDSVKIVNPDYVMKADTMDYNTETEIAFFTGPTELKGDSINLYCEKGWYDTKKDITSVWNSAAIDNKQQIIHGDSIFYDKIKGFGESFGNVVIEDTTNDMVIQGNYSKYFKQPERFTVIDNAVFIQISNGDSTFVHADTLNSVTITDSTSKSYRLMRAYYGCRIYSKSLQAKCDSLSYSFQDSIIRLYKSPVIWSDENQLTADSMSIYTKNRQTERLELVNSAFITTKIDTLRYNQIKGKTLTGYFKNNELYKIDINGNAESIYYLLDGESVAGVDQTKCVNIVVYVKKGKITEIYQNQSPEGFTDPPLPKETGEVRLKGFNWFDSIRPKKKSDIFNN
jgi:lipopolysaccharide export system protein LptA